jgi:hypothetical protein
MSIGASVCTFNNMLVVDLKDWEEGEGCNVTDKDTHEMLKEVATYLD